ncbi:hypothetical protein [Neobacillus sp. SAB-20_R2A]|uniref:hypothetical protein n=1 Tax=Neobacillus sp. SAB-20_R2A TaxID=3120519 RepID=UPI003C6E97A2
MEKLLLSIGVFIFSAATFFSFYEEKGMLGYGIAFGAALVLGAMSFIFLKEKEKRSLQVDNEMKKIVERLESEQKQSREQQQEQFLQLFTSQQNHQEEMAAMNQKHQKELLVINGKHQEEMHEVNRKLLEDIVTANQKNYEEMISINKQSHEEISAVNKRFHEEGLLENRKWNNAIVGNLSGMVAANQKSYENMVESNKQLYHTLFNQLEKINADNETFIDKTTAAIEKLVLIVQQLGQELKEQTSQQIKQTSEQQISIWNEAKENFFKILAAQQQSNNAALNGITEIQVQIQERLAQQEDLFTSAQNYYEETGQQLSQFIESSKDISEKTGVSIQLMEEQLNHFVDEMTDLFATKIAEQHEHLHQANDAIQKSLYAMQVIEKENIEHYKLALDKVTHDSKELFQLFYETQKRNNQNQDKWLNNFREKLEEKIADIRDMTEDMMEKQVGVFAELQEGLEASTKQLAESQQSFTKKQEQVYETIAQQTAATLENTKITKRIQSEIIDLNKQDIEILQKLVR